MKKILEPIEPKNSWSIDLQRALEQVMREVLFDPLFADYKKTLTGQENAKESALIRGIKAGDISYQNNLFKTKKWNSTLSRELKNLGAVWYDKEAAWMLPRAQMPENVATAIRISNMLTTKIMRSFFISIDEMPVIMKERLKFLDLTKYSDSTAAKTDRAFNKTVLKEMAVQPKLSPEERIFFDETYTKTATKPILVSLSKTYKDNVDDSMKYFTGEETEKLRKMVEEHVLAGRPRKELIEKIEGRLHVGYNRAKFIARQETALFTAEYKQAKYESSGIKKYKWRTVGDQKKDVKGGTRPQHQLHNNKTFFWNDPPIVDPTTGRRGHPGEDYNCRCVASPIVEF